MVCLANLTRISDEKKKLRKVSNEKKKIKQDVNVIKE